MNESSKFLIQKKGMYVYGQGSNNAYLLSKSNGGCTSISDIEYKIAEKLNIGDIYMQYSINLRIPCKKSIAIPYKIINKIVDQKNNILLIVDKLQVIELD